MVAGKHSGAIGDQALLRARITVTVWVITTSFTDATQTDVFGVGNNITVTESNSVALGSNSAISAGTHAGTSQKIFDGTAGTTTTAGATGTVKGTLLDKRRLVRSPWVPQVLKRRIQMWQQVRSVPPAPMRSMVASCTKPPKALPTQTNELDHRIHQNENKANAGFHQRWRWRPCHKPTFLADPWLPGVLPPTTVKVRWQWDCRSCRIMVNGYLKSMVQPIPKAM